MQMVYILNINEMKRWLLEVQGLQEEAIEYAVYLLV